MAKIATIDAIREAVRDCIEQDAVHGSAIHWDIGKDSDGNDRLFVTWGKPGEYTLIGIENNIGVVDQFVYTVHDYETGESIRFYADRTEASPNRWDDSGEPDFESEGLTTLANDLITMIDNPEYDLYGKVFEKHEDGSYYLTEEAAAEQERREKEWESRNSKPRSVPNDFTSNLEQAMLSAKHLLPPKSKGGEKID